MPFIKPRTPAKKRIGPHNFDILSILICSLLGDGHAQRDPRGHGTNFRFYYGMINKEYALYLHSLITNLGYCSPKIPQIIYREIDYRFNEITGLTIPAKNINTTRGIIRFNTFTFSSFNWIHDLFYINNVKVIPSALITEFLTAQGLAPLFFFT